jgi:uncharacterized protein YdeI (YjbR/CyaY-like superfamily)
MPVPVLSQWYYAFVMNLPDRLIDAFEGDAELLAWVSTLRESWQREITRWVTSPKSDEAKQRRCDDLAERLLLTMDAERELPLFLKRRLQATRDAWEGWQRMSLGCRRDYLLVIFGAKSEAARENQITRMLERCVAKGNSAHEKLRSRPAE